MLAVDAENAISKYRESLLAKYGPDVTVEAFQKLWVALGYDKVLSGGSAAPAESQPGSDEAATDGEDQNGPSGEEATTDAEIPAEGGEPAAEEVAQVQANSEEAGAVPASEPVPEVTSENYKQVWDLLTKDTASEKVSIQQLLGTIAICKQGYSETTFRTVLKLGDHAGLNAVSESAAWTAICRCVNRSDALSGATMRTHLRRAWRKAEKYAPPVPEGGEGGEEGTEEGPAAPPAALVIAAADQQVQLDSFVTCLQEDELAAEVLFKEVPVPIAPPPEPEGEAGEE